MMISLNPQVILLHGEGIHEHAQSVVLTSKDVPAQRLQVQW